MTAAYMMRDPHFEEELVELTEKARSATEGAPAISASVIKNAHVFNEKVEISGDWNS